MFAHEMGVTLPPGGTYSMTVCRICGGDGMSMVVYNPPGRCNIQTFSFQLLYFVVPEHLTKAIPPPLHLQEKMVLRVALLKLFGAVADDINRDGSRIGGKSAMAIMVLARVKRLYALTLTWKAHGRKI